MTKDPVLVFHRSSMPGFVYEAGKEYKPEIVTMIWSIFEVFGEDIPLTDPDCGGGKLIRSYRFLGYPPVRSNSSQKSASALPAGEPGTSESPTITKIQTMKKILSSWKAALKANAPEMLIPLEGTEFEILCWFMAYAKPAPDPKDPLASFAPPKDPAAVVALEARTTRQRVQMCVEHMYGNGSFQAKKVFAELAVEKHRYQSRTKGKES